MTTSATPIASSFLAGAPAAATTPRLLRELADVDRRLPVARKLLVGPDVNFGRELLHALGRLNGRGWMGWEATNLRRIAGELAFVALADRGLRSATDVETTALVQEALGAVADGAGSSARFRDLAGMLGFRRAVRDAVLELRTAGVSPDELRAASRPGSPAHDLAGVLAEYEQRLVAASLADPAAVFAQALASFDDEAPVVLPDAVFLVQSLPMRGLPGRLVERLLARGGRIVAADEPRGLARPAHTAGAVAGERGETPVEAGGSTLLAHLHAGERAPEAPAPLALDFFAAASPALELRQVLRRIAADGLRWDEVEIVTTDPDSYGVALDSLCQQLGASATMLHGVPLRCTRVGRALDRWLGWITDGLPADTLREALESGEIGVEGSEASPAAIARELRRLAIGWGRQRYAAALERLATEDAAASVRRREGEEDDALEARRASRLRSASALTALLRTLLDLLPPVPERGSTRPVRASSAALARATLRYLELVTAHGAAERVTMERLRVRLGHLADVTGEEESFGTAMAALRDGLSDLRAWPQHTNDSKPWAASGGMVHLTDVAHAGTTARARTFVVGLDAERTAGARLQDPLLTDDVRAALGAGRLATTAERRERSTHLLATALAGLRGRVTLSYATSGSDGRETGPAPELLQAFRLARGEPALSYRELRAAIGRVACAVPEDGDALVDGRDAWLGALADGPLLLEGERVVRAAFRGLDGGLAARQAAAGDAATAHHGVLGELAAALDPARLSGSGLSPSALEMLAKCPLSWFYRYGASLLAPDDREYDPDRWLGAIERGALLHDVYDRFVSEYRDRRPAIRDDGARTRVLEIVDEEIADWERELPPPGGAVFDAECDELRRSAVGFLELERAALAAGDDARWAATELAFGFEDSGRPVTLDLGGGLTLSLKGRIDRVDELRDGTLRVVDYKTGSAAPFRERRKHGDFHGGRHLQAALYAHAVPQLPEFRGRRVSRFEYRFPTAKGENTTVAYLPDELTRALPIVRDLIGHLTRGEFPPTTDANDCRYCDYGPVCRASRTERSCTSPRAEWAAAHAELPLLVAMAARRRPMEEG